MKFGLLDYLKLSLWYVVWGTFIYFQGALYGTVMYFVTVSAFSMMMKTLFNLELLGGADEIFFLDDHRNRGNIVACQVMTTCNFEKVRDALTGKAAVFPRLRSTVVKSMGKYWFKEQDKNFITKTIN